MARTREEIAKLILEGQVIVGAGRNGRRRIYGKLEEMPSAVDLAGDDIVKKKHALGELKRRAIEAQQELEEAAANADMAPDEIVIDEGKPEVETVSTGSVPDSNTPGEEPEYVGPVAVQTAGISTKKAKGASSGVAT